MKQVVFVVETDSRNRSDMIYLNRIISCFYVKDASCKVSWVFMGGNANYRSPAVLREIESLVSMLSKNKTQVVYVFDTDHSKKQQALLKEQLQYCKEQDYPVILFNSSIEDVLLGHRVSSAKDKLRLATDYGRSGAPKEKEAALSQTKPDIHQSNALRVLDKVLTWKRQGK